MLNIFQGALDAAKAVLDDEKATQEQVEHAFVNLQNAIFNLRLIPNKDKLEELLSKAEILICHCIQKSPVMF